MLDGVDIRSVKHSLELHDKFAGYMAELKNDGEPVERIKFSPMKVPSLLKHIVLIDAIYESERWRYKHRVVGTEVVSALGKQIEHSYIDENWHPNCKALWTEALDVARETLEPQLVHTRLEFGDGGHAVLLSSMHPLMGEEGEVNGIVGLRTIHFRDWDNVADPNLAAKRVDYFEPLTQDLVAHEKRASTA